MFGFLLMYLVKYGNGLPTTRDLLAVNRYWMVDTMEEREW